MAPPLKSNQKKSVEKEEENVTDNKGNKGSGL